MNATDITNLIEALRAETEKQSISPESVGYLLRTLFDYLTDIQNTLQSALTGLSLTHSTDKSALESEISTVRSTVTQQGQSITDLELDMSNAETSVNNKLSSQKTELEKRIGVLAVDGYVATREGAEGKDVGSVWYVSAESCFVVVEDMGISNFCVHNDGAKDWLSARTDCLYLYDGQLVVFDGENLVNWEPELLRDDINDLGDALSIMEDTLSNLNEFASSASEQFDAVDAAISDHVAEVSIFAFTGDGPPSTSSSAYNGPAGIYYSQSEGLFYKTTSTSPSLSVPHNANGKARTDCLFRKGNVLYQFDGTSLSEYVSPSVAAELAELRSLIANL